MPSEPPPLDRLVDVARYPLGELASEDGRELIEACREQFRAVGACELPGFVPESTVARMVAGVEALLPDGHHSAGRHTVYLDVPDATVPESDPRRRTGPHGHTVLAYDQFPSDDPLRALYEHPGLRAFLAAVLGVPTLFPYADPLGALNVAAMADGEELWWHFDQVDFVTSIALRSSRRGGDFEYVPALRDEDEPNRGGIAAVLDGDRAPRRVPMVPGTLLLFAGRNALHRVTPIDGDVDRLVALLAYDVKPGTDSSALLKQARYGRTH